MNKCQICHSDGWRDLVNPDPKYSITTAGRIIKQPLGKSQCSNCGFVQRINMAFLGVTDYYEKDYANYYERPGTQQFHKIRYSEIIKWMTSFILPSDTINKIIDVGCGQGWAMEAMMEKFPKSEIVGIEPSYFNSERAKEKGLFVMEGKIENLIIKEKYDLVYSNNVIQHVNDARQFIKSLSNLVKDNGIILITCPDGSKPNIELLWSDQNYSFLPEHLLRLCKDSGFKHIHSTFSPGSPSLPPAQLILLTNNYLYSTIAGIIEKDITVNLDSIYNNRNLYLSSLTKVGDFLKINLKNFDKVYNFGSSYWSSILAAYCPEYWEKVDSCLIEGPGDNVDFIGKKVYDISYKTLKENDALVLGINPASQTGLINKLSKVKNILTWDHLMSY